jgi:4-amino-4-deoxy-L-arabinose transferase-like glycosyltransferase
MGQGAGSNSAMAAEMGQFASRFLYFDAGRPGPLRLFLPPLANQASWLLPFALFSIFLAAGDLKQRSPLSARGRSLVLWGGWLLTGVIFFSFAGFIHTYYLVTMAPPLAAMTAIGAVRLWELSHEKPRLAALLLILAGGLTLAFQSYQARILTPDTPWVIPAAVLLLIGAALALVGLRPGANPTRLKGIALGCVLVAILVAPTAWGVLTTLDPTPSTVLPAAYSGRTGTLASLIQAFVNGDRADPALVSYLQSRTQGQEYLLAVPNALFGSNYVLETGRPVLLMGGFMGIDPVVNAQQLATLVSEGRLSYVWDSFGMLRLVKPQVYQWLQSSCTVVKDAPVPGLPAGALVQLGRVAEEMGILPKGTNPIPATGSLPAMPQNVLYHCGK